MITYQNAQQRSALIQCIENGYMEVFPSAGIEKELEILQPGSVVAVTCSPSKGIPATLTLTERLVQKGFSVIPHLAAKMVRNRVHLKEILIRLDDLGIEGIFVPGGDADQPLGDFSTAHQLLQAIAELQHSISDIGIAAHPESHPVISDEQMLQALQDKQPLATYIVTQMCFDPEMVSNWLHEIRSNGINLPIWLGIPGESDRAALLRTSLRIGVGDSLRFLKRKSDAAINLMRHKTYTPNDLLGDVSGMLVDPVNNIAGFHIFCFNQVRRTEKWRRHALAKLEYEAELNS